MADLTASPTIRRNLAWEREMLIEAGRGVVYESAIELANLAEIRSTRLHGEYVEDPMLIRLGVDRPREAIEEIADCVNHVLFGISAVEPDELTDGEMREMMQVLRNLAVCYDILKRHTAHA